MACNCGRRRVIRQSPGPVQEDVNHAAEALVANAQVQEIDVSDNRTDPATGVVHSREDT